MRNNEQGRSMIEMLGVLAIVGVLSVGGIAGYSKAMNKFKTNKMIDQVNMVATNIRTLYSSQRTYEGLNNAVAKKTGSVPAEMYTDESNSAITNAFGGKMYIAPAKQSDTSNDSFVIAITQIPQAACVSIATTEWGGDSGSGLLAMQIQGNATISGSANAFGSLLTSVSATASGVSLKGVDNLPYSIVSASSACSNGANLNTIAWKYL
jgi:type II secretory pathway pseudopilin PulG